ncbi:MAG: adenylosuccinate lyase [Candidatus Nitrosocaldus sp.]|nr:adenylosuccinate lyase [Candidatus Nitrosocaldus sp.]MDW8275274.1 adenylosuccinate lyase [Candidatus Nitrosocaldus sp.]
MPILPIDAGRYGSREVKDIFEEEQALRYALEFEACVAEAQGMLGVIPRDAAYEIARKARSGMVRLERVKELEAVREHDVAAMVEALVEVCDDVARPWVHYGLTSYDVVDSRIAMQLRDALTIIEEKIKRLTLLLAEKAEAYRDLPAVGRTHGQHASIISFGLKFAVWASDMLMHIKGMEEAKERALVCKTLGVVGTGSLMGDKAVDVQARVAEMLNLRPVTAATQVVSRERLAELIARLVLIACTLEKIAVEVRNLQRTEIGEVMEPFREGQMGSSAVPVKRNPIKSERVTSLARMMRAMLGVALENIPLWHERDLSNSANERFIIPMSIILLDEMLGSMIGVISGLIVDVDGIRRNIEASKGQVFAEFVLDALIRKGMDRIRAYSMVQSIAFSASSSGMEFRDALKGDPRVTALLSMDEIDSLFDARRHLASSSRIIDGVVSAVHKVCRESTS